MKLRNKKTGEIIDITCHKTGDFREKIDSLAELNAEWEDAPEEPKEYWYLENNGDVVKTTYEGNLYEEKMQEIGNYFETKEEAEKAVEKLKAWKQLKSHNLFISKGNRTFVNTDDVFVVQNVQFRVDTYGEVEDDLDLLFSQEGN